MGSEYSAFIARYGLLIAVTGALVGYLAIPALGRAFENTWNYLDDLWCRWRAHRRRCRNDQRRRWQRLALWLEPLHRHVPAALFYTLFVLLTSVAAPLLFVVFDKALRGWMDALYSTVTACMLIAAVAGFTTALFVSTLRGKRIKFAERVFDALAGKAATDHGVDADLVRLYPQHPLRHSDTAWHYYNILYGSEHADEWMICLHQLQNQASGSYTIENMIEQIEALERRHRAIRDEIVRCNICRQPPAIDWVCFISNTGRFCAMQSYATFRHQIVDRRNGRYLALLNQTDRNAFWKEIQDNMAHAGPQTTPGAAVVHPDAIPGLECFWIEKGTSREDALRLMIRNKKVRAMLVRDLREGAPLGVISLSTLAEQILFAPLDDGKPAVVTPMPVNHAAPPGLAGP